jgi:predicted esterase
MSEAAKPRLIAARVRGRYLWRPTSRSSALLVAFHGYAQNAEMMLQEVERLPGIGDWNVVAAQALHPFYSSRGSEVVASWMTRLDRDEAIADNIRYVGDLVATVGAELGEADPLVYLGFSQGTAMAYRAAVGSGHRCAGVIALAGDVPPELAAQRRGDFPPVLIGAGTEDEWYNQDKLEEDRSVLESMGAACRATIFAGGHEWTEEFRGSCGSFLEEILTTASGD